MDTKPSAPQSFDIPELSETKSEAEVAVLEHPSLSEQIKAIDERIRRQYEIRFTKEIADFKKELQTKNDEYIKNEIEEWRESQKPPSKDEIKLMLSQEYQTFDVELHVDEELKTFKLVELSQTKEKEFLKKVKDEIIPIATNVGALDFSKVDENAPNKVLAVVESFEPLMNLLADACVLALNPRGKIDYVNRQWIQDNISTYRIYTIVMAQMEVQKLRDFFSQLSRNSQGLGTATRAVIQK